jgi:hypothetical protein
MSIFSEVKEKVTQFVGVQVKLIKLNLIERSSSLLSLFVFGLICMFIFFCILLYIGLGVTEAFMMMGFSKMASFFLTVGVYSLILFLTFIARKPITNFFAGIFIKELTGQEKKDDGDDDE